MSFHPTGTSSKTMLAGQVPQVVALQNLSGDKKVVRIFATTFPANAVCYCNIGTDSVTVNSGNGMPLDLSASKEQFVGIGDETHLALIMSTNANYEIVITPGEIV